MKKLPFPISKLNKIIFLFLLVSGFTGATFGATFTVTKTADTNDGVCDADCSLREAVVAANAAAGDDTVLFSSLFNSAQTISLISGEIVIQNNGALTINGSGSTLLTISANNSSRSFMIQNNATANINNLKITDCNGNFGSAVYNGGMLTVRRSSYSAQKTVSPPRLFDFQFLLKF